jgi:CheY-like chemotaxis protein
MMKPKLLIVDDDAAITQQLFWTLCDDLEVMTAKDLSTAVRRTVIDEPHLVILDLHLPPTPDSVETGLRVLDYIKGHLPAAGVFVVSSESSAGGPTRSSLSRSTSSGWSRSSAVLLPPRGSPSPERPRAEDVLPSRRPPSGPLT